jgi:tetratricopeptide (TPR) repeat protein
MKMPRFLTTEILLSAAIVLIACGVPQAAALSEDPENNVQVLRERAREYTEKGEHAKALKVLLQANSIDPQDPEVRLSIGNAYIQMGQISKALEWWEVLLKEYPSNFALKNNMAWLYATTTNAAVKNAERAVVYAKEALLLSPISYEIWNTLSEGYTVLGEYRMAARASERALDLAIESQRSEAEIEQMREQVRKNTKLAQAVKDQSPVNQTEVGYWNNLGEYAMKRGRYREALGAYCIARLYEPENNSARFGEASVYIQIHKYRRGLEILEKLADEYPKNFSIKNNIAWLYATAQDFSVRDGAKAVAVAQKALLLDPNNYHIWSTLAEAYFILGDYEKAQRSAESALREAQLSNAALPNITTYRSQVEKCKRAVEAMSLIE